MALTREESLARYGTEAYTAWDEPGAQADASAKGINVMAKQPNPAQLTSSVSKPQFQKIKGFSDLQNQYAESVYNQPDYAGLYQRYAGETGLTDVKKLITNIDTSVADIEDKIARVEPNIGARLQDFDITEGQRQRMVTSEEQPLRTQYADVLRSRSKLSAEASSKADLVNTLMSYAQSDYTGRVNYLKTLVDIDEANKERAKTAASGNIQNYLGGKTGATGTPPAPTMTGPEMVADKLLKGLTIDDTGTVQSSNKSSGNQQFDKSGNLILGGGMQLTPTQNNKNKNMSSSTIFNRLLGNLA